MTKKVPITTIPGKDKVFDFGREMPPYWLALGEFISAFAVVESMLMTATWTLSGLDIPTGQAILSGSHIDQLTRIIKRLLVIKNSDPRLRELISEVLEHLGPINTARNEIVHYGMTLDSEGGMITNKKRFTAGKQNEIRLSPAVLGLMTHDLNKIVVHLIAFLSFSSTNDTERSTAFDTHLAQPWLYKG